MFILEILLFAFIIFIIFFFISVLFFRNFSTYIILVCCQDRFLSLGLI